MKLTLSQQTTLPRTTNVDVKQPHFLFAIVRSWEFYLVILMACVRCLYKLNITEFDLDQADIFILARSAFAHGHLIATSNISSIGGYNPPAIEYLLMIPAAITADPFGGVLFIAILGILSVIFTYIFTRRYYGRIAGTIAALTFTAATFPLAYARFMWNPSPIMLTAPIFMALLFWGVVEHRKGWFGWAIFLVGFSMQLHNSSLVLGAPLLLALLLAPWKTIRWYDVLLGLVLLVIVYAPYLVWLYHTHFYDLTLLLNTSAKKSVADDQVWIWYQHLVTPYDDPLDEKSVRYPFMWILSRLNPVITDLVLLSLAMALVLGVCIVKNREIIFNLLSNIRVWWRELRASPQRCGLLLLFVWQVAPILYLTNHSIDLQPHYFLVLIPGQFILIGILFSKCIYLLRHYHKNWARLLSIATYTFAIILIAAQLIGSMGLILDDARGYYHDGGPSYWYFHDLNSYQQALSQTDQYAQEHHISRVYLEADPSSRPALRYLAQSMKTSTTVFDSPTPLDGMANPCTVLPSPTAGPALIMVGPYSAITRDLILRYTRAKLVKKLPRLGGPDFSLFEVSTQSAGTKKELLSNNIEFMGSQSLGDAIVTQWSLQQNMLPEDNKVYTYTFNIGPENDPDHTRDNQCSLTSLQKGDQVLIFSRIPANTQSPIILKTSFFWETRFVLNVNHIPLAFETIQDVRSPIQQLKTSDNQRFIKISNS